MGHPTVNAGSATRAGVLSNGLVTSLVVLDKPGTLITGLVYNDSASTRYIQFFNATTLPADTTVPALPPLVVAAGTNVALDVFTGVYFDTGIVVASSSTDATLTITGAADMFVWVTTR
jgi:hypothetical protein